MSFAQPDLGRTVERIPPQNVDAERVCIGSVLIDREIMGTISEIVRASDFYVHAHETIFSALLALYERNEPLDRITLAEELKRRGALERVGGPAYLGTLVNSVQTAASAAYYAKLVREKSTLRSLIHAGTEIVQTGFEAEEDVEGAIDRSEQMIFAIGQRQMGGDFAHVGSLMKPALDELEEYYYRRGELSGVTTGFPDIDAVTTGFKPGNFVIIAARPGMGKTSFALNMAMAAARAAGQPVAFFSLEMSNSELVLRLLSATVRISMHDIRRGNIGDKDWGRIPKVMDELDTLPIFLDDSGGLSVSELRSRCRRLKATRGLGAVFIDYLQLLHPSSMQRQMNRNEEISEICRTLKVTAKDLEVPVIALAQLNRGVETRNEKRPMLADLRDSGSLEQEADFVAFLYREGYYNKEAADPELTEFIIAKHRNGPTGKVNLRFEAEYTLFQSYGDEANYPAP